MLKSRLAKSPVAVQTLYAITVAFGAYFCMYGFRKPFAVATFEAYALWGIDYKILLIISQVLGYMSSKFIGIKVIAELKQGSRAISMILLIVVAELALLGFGLVPYPYNFIFLFLNGLPLGMIWGIVFSYLEGRRTSELLGVGLCASFIVSSGAVKSVGKIVMDSWGSGEFWMPFVTGLIFLLPLIIFTYLLDQIPPPTEADEAMRCKRLPMSASDRRRFFLSFAPGLLLLIGFYMLLTAYRDFRDNFAAELWSALGYGEAPEIFTLAEIPIAVIVLLLLGLSMYIRNNKSAFLTYHVLILISGLLIGLCTYLFQIGQLSPALWMILVGLGLYLCYVPFNCMLFDRMIAVVKRPANAGYLIYLADAFGYLGSVSILLYKNFGQANLSWLDFFVGISYALSVASVVLIVCSMIYFFGFKLRKKQTLSWT